MINVSPRVRHEGERYLLAAVHERLDAIERLAVLVARQGYYTHWRVYTDDVDPRREVYALYKRRR